MKIHKIRPNFEYLDEIFTFSQLRRVTFEDISVLDRDTSIRIYHRITLVDIVEINLLELLSTRDWS